MSKPLQKAREKQAIAEAKVMAAAAEQTYRAIDDSHNRRKRSAPQIEFKGEDEQLGASGGRLKSIAKARDIRRNYPGAKGIETQMWLNTIGTCPKIIVHFEDAQGEPDEKKTEEWSNWFNSTYAKKCDGRGKRHLGDQAKNSLSSVIRDGDILVYFDHKGVIPNGEGQLWYWEADQLPELQNFKKYAPKIKKSLGLDASMEITQSNGIVCDEWGRAVGYIVVKNRLAYGKVTAKYKECTVLPADDCMLLFNPWRINQKRGVSDMIESANIWQDLERFTEALIQRSIVQSFLALKVKKKESTIQARDRIYDTEDPNGIPTVASDEKTSGTHYKNFEKLSMNAIEYVDEDEDIESMQLAGDLPNAEELITYMMGNAGWAQGLSNMYATGKANGSYSAAMAENNITWAMFEWWQKFMERYFFDWVAGKALAWANDTGRVTRAALAEWMDNYSWHNWPKKKAINPSQEANARKTDLTIGAIDYEDLHGPYWGKKLRNLGKQIMHSRDNGFFTPLFKPDKTQRNTGNTPK